MRRKNSLPHPRYHRGSLGREGAYAVRASRTGRAHRTARRAESSNAAPKLPAAGAVAGFAAAQTARTSAYISGMLLLELLGNPDQDSFGATDVAVHNMFLLRTIVRIRKVRKACGDDGSSVAGSTVRWYGASQQGHAPVFCGRSSPHARLILGYNGRVDSPPNRHADTLL